MKTLGDTEYVRDRVPTPAVIADHPNVLGERSFHELKTTWDSINERINYNQQQYETLANSLDNDRRLRSQLEEAMNALSGYVPGKGLSTVSSGPSLGSRY